MNRKLLKYVAIDCLFLCSTICADKEEVSTNEGEEADEEEDGAECSMFKEISTECVCLIYMDLVRNTVILIISGDI